MSALKPYEPTPMHWDTARERDVDMKLDAEERESDSREKLEEEVCSFFASNKLMRDSAMEAFVTGIVYGWLDRQAAITEQECIDQRIADQIGSIWKDEKVRKLQAKVDELTQERDRALADAKTQRNNFEIATKARKHWKELAAKSKGEVDDLRQSLDETIEERNELQAKLDDFDGDCYCGATVVQWYEHSVRLQGRLDEMEQTRMCLPVDAGGVPCRIGDVLDWDGGRHEVMAVSDDCVWFDTDAHEVRLTCCESRECRHVQDTLESLLVEYAVACEEKGWKDPRIDGLVDEFAERIRKAVER